MNYYTLSQKELSQLFLPFSRNSNVLEKFLPFSLNANDIVAMTTSPYNANNSSYAKPVVLESPVKLTPKEEFISNVKELLSTKKDFQKLFSLYLETKNKTKQYNFAAAFEDGLNEKIKAIQQLDFSEQEKLVLQKNYLVSVVAYLAYNNFRHTDTLIEVSQQLEQGIPFHDKLLSKNLYIRTQPTSSVAIDYQSNLTYFHPIHEAPEHLKQAVFQKENYEQNFDWEIDETLLIRSWGHEEYVLDEMTPSLRQSVAALFSAEPEVLQSSTFWEKASDILWSKLAKFNYKGWSTDNKFSLPQEIEGTFSSKEEFNNFLKIILNEPIFTEKFLKEKNSHLLFSLYEKAKSGSYSDKIKPDLELVKSTLERFLNRPDFIVEISKTVYLGEYFNFFTPKTLQDNEVINALARNISLKGQYSSNHIFTMLLDKIEHKENVTYAFLLNFFQQANIEKSVEIPISYYDKTAGDILSHTFSQLTDGQFIELFKLQPALCLEVQNRFFTKEQKNNQTVEFLDTILHTVAFNKNVSSQSSQIFQFLNQHPKGHELFGREDTQIYIVKLFGYKISRLSGVLVKALGKNKDILLKALETDPTFIKDSNWPLEYFDNNEYLKLIKPPLLLYVYQDSKSAQLALTNTANKPVSEQLDLIKNDPLFYFFCSKEIKYDIAHSVNYCCAVLNQKPSNSSFHSGFNLRCIPPEVLKSHDFAAQIVFHMAPTKPKEIMSLIDPKLWFNQKFILNLCRTMDRSGNYEILNLLPPKIQKFFTSFGVKERQYTEFMTNYIMRQNLQKEIALTPAQETNKSHSPRINKI